MDRSVYLSWAALALAIMANVAANTSLKQAMISVSTDSDKSILLQVLAVPSFWIGLVFAGVLLLSYLVAIRNMPVGTAYAFTTSLAMVGIIIVEHRLFGTPVGMSKAAGIAFVALGVWLMTRAA